MKSSKKIRDVLKGNNIRTDATEECIMLDITSEVQGLLHVKPKHSPLTLYYGFFSTFEKQMRSIDFVALSARSSPFSRSPLVGP